uniref:Uncharacterized protein n=1 Tax=Amphimedon queenslandica TaxID=400682 RepID=A0A1X7U711_AMPQE
MESNEGCPNIISDAAIIAAINFVDYCIQNAAYLAGRGPFDDEITLIAKTSHSTAHDNPGKQNASFCLTLPGQKLYVNALLEQRKFRDKGNKDGAVRGLKMLQEAGLGKLIEVKAQRGTNLMYEFEKTPVPEDSKNKSIFLEKLFSFCVSLTQYKAANSLEDVKIDTVRAKKDLVQNQFVHRQGKY